MKEAEQAALDEQASCRIRNCVWTGFTIGIAVWIRNIREYSCQGARTAVIPEMLNHTNGFEQYLKELQAIQSCYSDTVYLNSAR
jgi:hypothetical protein